MKFCFDAGHYGAYNQSPCNKAYYESDMVWRLHLLVKKYVSQYEGAEVITTRDNQNSNPALYSRGAASKGCALFLSFHSNAADRESVDYPVSYCAIDGSADEIGGLLAKCVEDVMHTRQHARIEHRRGQHGDYYGVVRGAAAVGTPGLILEHSFHTNARATEWLLNPENLDRLAQAEAQQLAAFYGLKKTPRVGWVQEPDGRRYYLDSHRYVANDWYRDGASWYWFDGAGRMVSDTWYCYQGRWYYLGTDGAMVQGQQTIDGKWYYFDSDGKMAIEPIALSPDDNGALMYTGLINGRKDRCGRTWANC